MAAYELQVQYVHMSIPNGSYQHIERIGSDFPTWDKSKAEAIDDIESGRHRYYVVGRNGFNKVYVHVEKPTPLRSSWYLKTHPDGLLDNNLLSLPRRPRMASVVNALIGGR